LPARPAPHVARGRELLGRATYMASGIETSVYSIDENDEVDTVDENDG
jgi:hypothetical protein